MVSRENSITIFTRISFYSVDNENRKVKNRTRSTKSGASKTDKPEQKCLDIDRRNLNQKYDNIEK
jgi:hypothetical protein